MKLPLALLVAFAAISSQKPPSENGAKGARATPKLNSLARDVERVESVREIKDVTSTFAQLAQFGRWADMAALFTGNGTLQWDKEVAEGPEAIEMWLKADAADMDGINPGSLDTLIATTPLVNLAADGRSANGRFSGLRFQGDGAGDTRIQGGIYENEYEFDDDRWKISLLHYYPLYNGTYANGWSNAGGGDLTLPPFHYTSDEAGIPIPPPTGEAGETSSTAEELEHRISILNDEDEVRNLQHAYGYYVDRRMWTDVVDLFSANSMVKIDNIGSFKGPSGVREAMEQWMGPEGLTQGVLNEHLIFDTVVHIHPTVHTTGQQALARGIEIGLLGDANKTAGWWYFNVFYNRFVKEDGIWKLKDLNISPLVVANYSTGWGKGSTMPQSTEVPEFLEYASRSARKLHVESSENDADLADLQRRLARSAAYDGTENVSNAYGFYIDFIDGVGCKNMADVHAKDGHKESPFAGFYQTRERVLRACTQYYGSTATISRASVSFHWRPQPVIIVSQDGRSASVRTRLFQPTTEKNSAGILRGAIYHDQTIIEDGIWRLWSVTIDEFYWTSSSWKDGWPGVRLRDKNAPNPAPRALIQQYPPDVTLVAIGDPRETGFQGGTGRFTTWPEIQRMWFAYRNPVSGRVPDSYWPGCVPCQDRPAWNLTRNGYQEPPTGPTIVTAEAVRDTGNGTLSISVSISGGPDEPMVGVVSLEGDEIAVKKTLAQEAGGRVTFLLPDGLDSGLQTLSARYLGSDRLNPGQATITVTLP